MTFSPQDADAWYERNKHKLGVGEDPVFDAVIDYCLPDGRDQRVFEFGCANGWRLQRLIEWSNIDAWGSEISQAACRDADKRIKLNLDPAISSCDVIIFGFCLYVMNPSDLMRFASHADLCLRDGGYIIIHDFLPDHPYARVYEHNPELRSRKMDHAQLWLGHPAYSIIKRDIYREDDERTHVTVLRKNMANAFPLKEDTNATLP